MHTTPVYTFMTVTPFPSQKMISAAGEIGQVATRRDRF